MTVGDNMQQIVDLVNELTEHDTDHSLKLLALVVGEYMINADATEMDVDEGIITVSVKITTQEAV